MGCGVSGVEISGFASNSTKILAEYVIRVVGR
jgi:hypothetical protein